MYGKPYHKLPVSSWMIPGGNRDQKRKLMMEQKYPMKSAIQKNLGGPLSEVFFSCLSPSQQDHIGYTPKLQGPGKDLWVSPSDILIGQVVLTPPYTSRLRQALTHQGIMEIGTEIEQKLFKKHEAQMQSALQEKEAQMLMKLELMVREAVQFDRQAQKIIYEQILEKANNDIIESNEIVLEETLSKVLIEGVKQMEEAVIKTKRELEQQFCISFESGQDNLRKQYEFQLALRDSHMSEKYENQLKKYRQDCLVAMDEIQKEFIVRLERAIAKLEAEHVIDLLIQASEKSQLYHEEKLHMESAFKTWFVKYFENEMVQKQFSILELQDVINKMKKTCERREDQLREVFRHFQKFINFALKEKPGQAEFLLSIQKELQNIHQEKDESEVELIARMIIEYIITIIQEKKALEDLDKVPVKVSDFTEKNFREKIKNDRENNRIICVVGEEENSVGSQLQSDFIKNQAKSLVNMLDKHPTMQDMLDSTFSYF